MLQEVQDILEESASPELRTVVNFIRSSKSGIKVRTGALNGKRIDYFKGKSAVKALLSPAYAKLKNAPKVTSEEEASAVLTSLMPYNFFIAVERGGPTGSASSPKALTPIGSTTFESDHHYAWIYEGSQWTTYAGGVLMVVIMLAGVMFPLWPPIMRLGVWYLSIGMLGLIGLFFAIAIVRLIVFMITYVVASPGLWIYPQLFADVGFFESFVPLYEWNYPKKKGKKGKKGKDKDGKKHAISTNGQGASIQEVDDSADSRPVSRGVRIEDADDE